MSQQKSKKKKSRVSNESSSSSLKASVYSGEVAAKVVGLTIALPRSLSPGVCSLSPLTLRRLSVAVGDHIVMRHRSSEMRWIVRVWASPDIAADECVLDDAIASQLPQLVVGLSRLAPPVHITAATTIHLLPTCSLAPHSPLSDMMQRHITTGVIASARGRVLGQRDTVPVFVRGKVEHFRVVDVVAESWQDQSDSIARQLAGLSLTPETPQTPQTPQTPRTPATISNPTPHTPGKLPSNPEFATPTTPMPFTVESPSTPRTQPPQSPPTPHTPAPAPPPLGDLFLITPTTGITVTLEPEPPTTPPLTTPSSLQTPTPTQPGKGGVVTWNMVGGLSAEIQQIRDAVGLALRAPEQFVALGVDRPCGVLLSGPPGTGKTLIARACAGEMGVPVFVLNGPDIVGQLYGESEERLRAVFSSALASAPSLIFIDEIDAIAPTRTDGIGGGSQADQRLVSALLAQMDALGSSTRPVVVVAASNRPASLDPALRRTGRLDREIEIGVPNADQRREILQCLLGSIPHAIAPSDISAAAAAAHGFVGADLAQVIREATLAMVHRIQQAGHSSEVAELLTEADLALAMSRVRPSSMREVAIDVPHVLWSDVGGQEDVKMRLKEAIEWPLKHPEAFERMRVAPPKGLLLYGPPGCSKTLMAKALATESALNFIAVKGPELFSKWVGESEKAIAKVFSKARAAAPSIIFFDEIDAIGGKRGSGGASGVESRVLAQLLVELDGIHTSRQVTFIAATNRPDVLDPALLRPGRVDRALYIAPPDLPGRSAILTIHTTALPLDPQVDLGGLAAKTDGYSGAELAALCREAALTAMRSEGETVIRQEHFDAALCVVLPRLDAALIEYYQKFADRAGVQQV